MAGEGEEFVLAPGVMGPDLELPTLLSPRLLLGEKLERQEKVKERMVECEKYVYQRAHFTSSRCCED